MSNLLIPRIFHRIWVGDKTMPNEFISYGKTWMKHHPNWEMRLWTDKNMMKLQNQKFYDNTKNLAQKSDIARLEILYNFGGIYIDCDFECLKNIEPLLNEVEAFGVWESEGMICNAILGSTPKNSIFKMLVDGIPTSIQSNKDFPINHQTGPIYISPKLKSRKNIVIFNSELFYPYLWNEKYKKGIDFPNAYAIHHWEGSWL